MAAVGVLWFGIYNVALNAGERRIDAGTAAMLIQVSPILVAVLALFLLRERSDRVPRGGHRAGVQRRRADRAVELDRAATTTCSEWCLCLLAAVVYAISLVLQKPLVGRLPALQVTWVACTVGAVGLPRRSPGELVGETADASLADVGWLVYLGRVPDRDRVHDLRLRARAT